MKQIFETSSPILEHYFRRVWEESVEVAAISHYFSDGLPHLESEQAMLGGLVHNIGALPVLARIDETPDIGFSDDLVQALLEELAPEVGTQVMEAWNFPSALKAVPKGCVDLKRDSGPQVDYVDIVQAARLQHLLATGDVEMQPEWANLAAFKKLGIQVEVVVLDEAGPANWIDDVRCMLEV